MPPQPFLHAPLAFVPVLESHYPLTVRWSIALNALLLPSEHALIGHLVLALAIELTHLTTLAD